MAMDLNVEMASLELNEANCAQATEPAEDSVPTGAKKLRRSSRKHISTHVPNCRVTTKPKKLVVGGNLNDVEKYYLSSKIKRLPSTLETIYEEPRQVRNNWQYMSVKKFKRVLEIDGPGLGNQKQKKLKKRLMKVKSVSAQNRITKRKRLTLDYVLSKLAILEMDNKET